jgi:hypothetical protein
MLLYEQAGTLTFPFFTAKKRKTKENQNVKMIGMHGLEAKSL